MDKKEIKELLQKCFGKNKNDRYHGIAMLMIYGIFMFILILVIRLGGTTTLEQPATTNPTSTLSPTENIKQDIIEANDNMISFDVNYSYSYTVNYNGSQEIFLGKKVDSKEKFTYMKDDVITEYAILNDHYLILKDGTYHIAEKPNSYLKYCDVEKILSLIANEIDDSNGSYLVSNQKIANMFYDTIVSDQRKDNLITVKIEDQVLKEIDIDFSHYLSSITNNPAAFTVHMEFVDIGTTEDFEIKVS